MAGLFRFDAYPRDWFLDTRELSQAAKGVYIDMLMAMYARGGPLPNNESELCRLSGCATARSLRPLLAELISKEKIRLVNGHLSNGRTMREIEKFNRRQAIASEGGKARSARVQLELSSNSARTQPVTQPGIEENQQGNMRSRARAVTVYEEERRFRFFTTFRNGRAGPFARFAEGGSFRSAGSSKSWPASGARRMEGGLRSRQAAARSGGRAGDEAAASLQGRPRPCARPAPVG